MKIEEFSLELLRQVGIDGSSTAMSEVERIYTEVHGRSAYDDMGSLGFVKSIAIGTLTPDEAELIIRKSAEHRRRSELSIRALYEELLFRDPGPREPEGEWITGGSSTPAGNGALGYVTSYQLGDSTLDQVRESIKKSPEYKDKHRGTPSGNLSVKNFTLRETFPDGKVRDGLMSGTSLFYAMSPDVSRANYLLVIDFLQSVGIRMARFAQTFTWDNPPKMANIIPFRNGNAYTHNEGVDKGKSVDWRPSDQHFSELEWRLDQAAQRGIHVQYTIFWGGMQPLFTRGADGKPGHPPGEGGHTVMWDRVEEYVRYIGRFFKQHKTHAIEIINEADHGHHLAKQGFEGRVKFLERCSKWILAEHPAAVITASDGGHAPRIDGRSSNPAPEGSPYFDYNAVKNLSYWNVHFPRDTVTVQGFPRWARGSWHLYQDRGPFRETHPTMGYGRSDENIFLTTEAEFKKWGYRGSTRDWRMYGLSWWVTAMTGAGFTVHNYKGFFCQTDIAEDPIFSQVARAFAEITAGFPWQGSSPFNTGWNGSPVKDYDGPFKCFTIVGGQNRRVILVTVLEATGVVTLDLDRAYQARVFEITGETRRVTRVGPGLVNLAVSGMSYGKGAIVRLDAL